MALNRLKLAQEVQCPRRDTFPKLLYRKRTSFRRSRLRKSAKNFNRRLRRKRSITRYYDHLKNRRYTRKAEDLCSSVSLFGIGDMEIDNETSASKSFTFVDPMTAVNEWHKYEQVAYWKSRAIALEYENKMLHAHLRDMYASYIHNGVSAFEKEKMKNGDSEKQTTKRDIQKEVVDKEDTTEEPAISRKADGEKRRKEMDELYGKEAPKVMGMETAIQLNYDHHLEQSNVPLWPIVPLNSKKAG